MSLAPGVLLKNRYRINRFLAQGESGAVYQAWDTQAKRNCAVKEYFDTSLGLRQRFDRLAVQLMDLDHPGLPRVWDAFLQPGSGLYLVMAYIEGEDLRQMMLTRGGSLPEAQVLGWVSQVCAALAYLHEQIPPLFHTDIKPANIRITPEGQAVLVDLGTLRQPGAAAYRATAQYIAPEVAEQNAWDEQSDVYAVGATLFTLLTGKPPTEADIKESGFALRRGISPRVGLLIERALLQDKTARLENIAEFRKILVEAITPQPEMLLIPPTPLLEDQAEDDLAVQSSLWNRLPWPVLLLGVSALLILVGILVTHPAALTNATPQPQASATLIAQIATQISAPQTSAPTLMPSPTLPAPTMPPTAGALQATPTFTLVSFTQAVADTATSAATQQPTATQPPPTQSPTTMPEATPLTASQGFYFFTGHETGVFSVAYSPDGRWLASGSADGQIILWNVQTGEKVYSLQGHSGSVNTLAFSPDSQFLASGSGDKTVMLWNVASGANIRTLTEHNKSISDIIFSPDGLVLVCASQDSTATVWNLQSGELLDTLVANVSKDLPAGFSSLAFSPDGSTLVIGTAKGVVLWNTEQWTERRTEPSNVLSLVYSPDGNSIAMGLMTGGVTLLDMRTFRTIHTFQKHTRPVTGVAYSPDGKLLASVSRDGWVILWDVAQRNMLRILEGHSDAVTDLAFSPDGKLLVTASVDGTVILWDVANP